MSNALGLSAVSSVTKGGLLFQVDTLTGDPDLTGARYCDQGKCNIFGGEKTFNMFRAEYSIVFQSDWWSLSGGQQLYVPLQEFAHRFDYYLNNGDGILPVFDISQRTQAQQDLLEAFFIAGKSAGDSTASPWAPSSYAMENHLEYVAETLVIYIWEKTKPGTTPPVSGYTPLSKVVSPAQNGKYAGWNLKKAFEDSFLKDLAASAGG